MKKDGFELLKEKYPEDSYEVVFTQLDNNELSDLKVSFSYDDGTDKTDVGKKK